MYPVGPIPFKTSDVQAHVSKINPELFGCANLIKTPEYTLVASGITTVLNVQTLSGTVKYVTVSIVTQVTLSKLYCRRKGSCASGLSPQVPP